MKFSTVAAVLASASATYGHSIFQKVYVNGVDQGTGTGKYIRVPPSNSPVKDVSSTDIICNVGGQTAASSTIEVSAGDDVTFEWFHNTPLDDIIDPTHKGPVQAYIAPAASNGVGKVWVKLASQGFTDDWATNKLIASKGHHSITLPNLAAGEYLLRPEIIALHEGDTDFKVNSARGAQFYTGCAQIKVVSAGSVALPAGIDFQKDYTTTDPGILFNVYGGKDSSYVAPGGAVSSISAGGSIGPVPAAGSKPSTTAAALATTAVASTSVVVSTPVVISTSVAPVPTTTAVVSSVAPAPTSVKPLSSTKMIYSTIKPSSTAAPVSTAVPTASACPSAGSGNGASAAVVTKWGQCGGINFTGSTACVAGSTCTVQNPYYHQCL